MKTTQQIIEDLKQLFDPEKRAFYPKYFKAEKGGYGEGDKFLGVTVPNIRKIANKHKNISYKEIQDLIQNEYHEGRFCALIILLKKFEQAKMLSEKKFIHDFYLANTQYINNWDLVDVSCRTIIGEYLLNTNNRKILYKLSKSKSLWEQRIAIVSTWTFIKNKEFEDTFQLAKYFITHPHDLIHKASGWMLREIGKIDSDSLCIFLDEHAGKMPRTMLRYSLERLSEKEKFNYMNMKIIKIASAIITDENNRLLLVRKKNSKTFILPGGKIEKDEKAINTLKRELKEEINFENFEEITFVGKFNAAAANELNHRIESNIYKIKIRHQNFKANAEIEEVKWVKPKEITKLSVAPMIKENILPIWQNS